MAHKTKDTKVPLPVNELGRSNQGTKGPGGERTQENQGKTFTQRKGEKKKRRKKHDGGSFCQKATGITGGKQKKNLGGQEPTEGQQEWGQLAWMCCCGREISIKEKLVSMGGCGGGQGGKAKDDFRRERGGAKTQGAKGKCSYFK